MPRIRNLRWIGLIVLVGVIGYAVASIVSEPFERETAQQLYQAITENEGQWLFINGLATVGLVALFVGFLLMTHALPGIDRRLSAWGLALFSFAVILWLIEAVLRITTTVSTAADVVAGGTLPTAFPQSVGVGLEMLFLAYLATALGGIALLVWSLGQSNLMPAWVAYAGAALTVVSGVVAAATYPWVGGVERTLFYPLVLVALPLSVWLLIRGDRYSALDNT